MVGGWSQQLYTPRAGVSPSAKLGKQMTPQGEPQVSEAGWGGTALPQGAPPWVCVAGWPCSLTRMQGGELLPPSAWNKPRPRPPGPGVAVRMAGRVQSPPARHLCSYLDAARTRFSFCLYLRPKNRNQKRSPAPLTRAHRQAQCGGTAVRAALLAKPSPGEEG